jgi:septum site-determining protein MinC
MILKKQRGQLTLATGIPAEIQRLRVTRPQPTAEQFKLNHPTGQDTQQAGVLRLAFCVCFSCALITLNCSSLPPRATCTAPMNPKTSSTDASVFSIKSASFDAIRLVLEQPDLRVLKHALHERLKDAADFFEDDPVIIDASLIDQPLNWRDLCTLIQEFRMRPIGAVALGQNATTARQAGVALLDLRATLPRPVLEEMGSAANAGSVYPLTQNAMPFEPSASGGLNTEHAPAFNTPTERTLLLNRPVRSGQRVYARGGDIIVTGFVSRGAEIIADGNVHIYGPLRGRAIAGARGDAGARIFTTHLDAELVAVAGVYRTSENSYPVDVFGRPSLIRLVGERLLLEPIAQD